MAQQPTKRVIPQDIIDLSFEAIREHLKAERPDYTSKVTVAEHMIAWYVGSDDESDGGEG